MGALLVGIPPTQPCDFLHTQVPTTLPHRAFSISLLLLLVFPVVFEDCVSLIHSAFPFSKQYVGGVEGKFVSGTEGEG